jgi:hypothetical protein
MIGKENVMSEESSAPESAEISQESAEAAPQEHQAEQSGEAQGEQQQLQDAVETALANGASEKEVKNLIKEFQLKVNGKTISKKIDLSDEAALKNELQLSAAARQAMQEAANLKKLYEKEVGRLKQNPWEVLQELGMDPDELAELRIQSRIEEMKKSPEQLERERIQKELQEAREEAKRLKEEREAENFEKLKQQAAIQIENEIEAALDAHKTLPKSRHIVKRIADSLLWAMDQGYEDATVEDVLPMVEKEWRDEMSRLMDDSSEDILEQLIGQRNIERLRAKRLAGMNQAPKTAAAVKSTAASIQKQEQTPAQKMKQRDFFRSLGKK